MRALFNDTNLAIISALRRKLCRLQPQAWIHRRNHVMTPRLPPNDAFDAFKEDIRSMIDDYTNIEIIEELKIKGFHTSLTALKYQLQDWGFRASVWDPGSAHRGSDQCC